MIVCKRVSPNESTAQTHFFAVPAAVPFHTLVIISVIANSLAEYKEPGRLYVIAFLQPFQELRFLFLNVEIIGTPPRRHPNDMHVPGNNTAFLVTTQPLTMAALEQLHGILPEQHRDILVKIAIVEQQQKSNQHQNIPD